MPAAGSVGAVLRVFFSRRWLGWHALLLAGVAVLVLLGRWQWDRAQSQTGTLQNLGYAFEWWLFACLAVYGWWREMRADAKAAHAAEHGETSSDRETTGSVTAGLGRSAMSAGSADSVNGAAGGSQPNVEDVDEEVAAYNAYLAQLHARDIRQRH